MQALTLEIIMRAVFGTSDERLRALLERMLDRMTDPGVLMFAVLAGPNANHTVFHRLRKPADALLREEIHRRRSVADLEEREDILSMLLAHTDMDDQQLLDELFTLLVAGHETTATALSWALERLAHHPHAWERLRSGDEDYLDATVKEILRHRPVVPAVIRLLKAPFSVAGYDLPAGVAVVPTILTMHTREDIYPEPFAFRPGALPREARRDLHVDPVRRRRAPLPRGELRDLRDEGRAARGGERDRDAACPPQAEDERPRRRAVTLIPGKDGRVIAARRTAPARREQPVPSGR